MKISLLKKNGSVLETFKTSLRKNDPNPQFNECTIFKVSSRDFNQTLLKLSVYEIKNEHEFLIGNVLIGPKTNSSSNNHWQYMLKQVRRQVLLKSRLLFP